MRRRGSSPGKGAGWPTFRAETAGKFQILLVYSKNSSRVMVACRFWGFFRLKPPLEKIRMYSWMSRSVGLAGDFQDPQAVEPAADAALFQMISPRIRKPKPAMPWM